ncbi:MAG: hypothetical protein LC641_10130, partial [Spirochaeta sp.]|nr:hypothetical protein [Spirochaeta sp.]
MQNNVRPTRTTLLLTAVILAAAGIAFWAVYTHAGTGSASSSSSTSQPVQLAVSGSATHMRYAEN